MKQIKNTVTIACKIAIKQESNIRFIHLQQTITTSKAFLSEFNKLDYSSSVFLQQGYSIIDVKALEYFSRLYKQA